MHTKDQYQIVLRRNFSVLNTITAFLILLFFSSCISKNAAEPTLETYQEAAQSAFETAQKAFDRRDYIGAVERFERVRNRFPHSPYAALAELRVADCLFIQDRYLEAADAYRTFVNLRPAHEEAAYAAYREALSLMQQAPSDLWIMPPAHEKDLTYIQEVIKSLQRFMRDYPESEYADEAGDLLNKAMARLASHEMYVADFYRKRGHWMAVVFRLESVLESYPGVGFDEEAAVGLAEALLEIEEPRPMESLELLNQLMSKEDLEPSIANRAKRLQSRLDH